MSAFKAKDGTEIYYKDWASGQPIVFHHGWPLSADDWDAQMKVYPGFPHGMCTTHPEIINRDLLAFVKGERIAGAADRQLETA